MVGQAQTGGAAVNKALRAACQCKCDTNRPHLHFVRAEREKAVVALRDTLSVMRMDTLSGGERRETRLLDLAMCHWMVCTAVSEGVRDEEGWRGGLLLSALTSWYRAS